MFVSRSKYEDKVAEARLLETRVQDALDKVALLEAENAELVASLEQAEAICQQVIPEEDLTGETFGLKSFILTKSCNHTKVEALQVSTCWEPGELLSQKRYCLGEDIAEIEKAFGN